MSRFVIGAILVLSGFGSLHADRIMTPDETETLIRRLTDNPRSAWIPQGMIRARHMEYYEYDNSMKETTETVYRDGQRYRMEMHLEDGLSVDDVSRTQNQFNQDLRLNRDRTFVWDGQKYIQYYQSADYAVVVSDSDQSAHELCGPATAGIIPWGHGDYTFLVLKSQAPTARIITTESQNMIHLEYINNTIALETTVSFVLAPDQNNAVLSYSIENEQALLRQTYEDYFEAGSQWVPSKILIERFDKRSGTPQLISYEDWQFETVDPTIPADDRFRVNFKNGTMVELQATAGLKTFMYNASDRVDISTILEDKIALLQAPDPDAVNCATAAVQHVAKRFSKNIQAPDLAQMVSQETQKTALSEMKQTLEQAGLTCMAVETDLETLEKLPDCSKILYLEMSDHYVIVDHIEPEAIWIIDLTDRKFYAKKKLDEFLLEWTDGIALLVSNQPITPPLDANFRYLQTDEMTGIYGGGGFGKYSCTDKIQGNYHILCPKPIGDFLCCGGYYIFYERYACIEDENGGICSGEKLRSYDLYHCLNDPFKPGECRLPNLPITRFVRACQ